MMRPLPSGAAVASQSNLKSKKMRNLTVCMIAFAMAFSATAMVFHFIIEPAYSEQRRTALIGADEQSLLHVPPKAQTDEPVW